MTGAGLLLGLSTGATFSLVLIGRCFYFGDFQGAFEPLRGILGRSWREGLPLWSPALSNGMPLLASPFVGALYPPNLVFALSTSHTARVLSLLVVLHVLFGGWGAALLARRLGQSAAGAAAAGVAFALAGATVSGTYLVVLVCTAMWLPWLLLSLSGVREQGKVRGLALGAALGMMLLAGDPVMILAACLGGASLFAGSRPSPGWRPLFLGLVLGALLAAPSLLALRRYFPSTVRAGGLPPAERLSRSLHPLEAVGFLVPNAFGSRVLGGPDGFLYPGQASGNGFPLFPGLYVGVCAFALAGVGAVRAPVRMRLFAWLLLLGLLALGRYGPLAFASSLPGLSSLRFPSKWILAAALPFALLVGGGVSTLESGGAKEGRGRLAGVFACALIAMAAIAAGANLGLARLLADASSLPGGETALLRLTESLRSRLLEGTARGALPALLALGIVRFVSGERRAAWLVSGILALDLVTANRSLAPTAPARFYESTPAAIRVIQGDPMGHSRVWVNQSGAARWVASRTPADRGELLDAALGRRRERLDAYAAASYGLSLAFHVDLEALATARYSLLTRLLYSAPPRAQITLLGAAGVSHLVSPLELTDVRLVEIASLDVGADRPLHVYRNGALLPRARLVKLIVPVRTERLSDVFAGMEDDLFHRAAIVDEQDLPAVAAASRAARFDASGGDVRVVEDAGSRVVLQTNGGGGYLVLTDSFAPGWRARIDGRPRTIFPADIAFRMIVVPAGTHDVVFDYNPWRR